MIAPGLSVATDLSDVMYALIPVGIGEKAAAGVFRTREGAEDAAQRLWAASDGYHTFEVHQMVVDTTYDSYPRGERYGLTEKPLQCEFKSALDLRRLG